MASIHDEKNDSVVEDGSLDDADAPKAFKAPSITADPTSQLSLQKALKALVGRDKFSDVDVTVGKAPNTTVISAHRVVLASASPVLAKLLYPQGADTPAFTHKAKQQISLPDFTPELFHAVLACVYSDRVPVEASILSQLMDLSQTYQIEVLRQACIDFMTDGVTAENSCELFESMSARFEGGDFAIDFIRTNASDVFKTEGFERLSEPQLLRLLDDDKLVISEAEVFRAVLRWGARQLLAQKREISPATTAQVLAKSLPKVRFHTMSSQEIAIVVAPSRLLPPSQLLELFTYIAQASTSRGAVPALFSRPMRVGGMPLTWGFSRRFASSTSDIRASSPVQAANDTLAVSGGSTAVYNHAHGSTPLRSLACWRIKIANSTGTVHMGLATNTRFPDFSIYCPGVYLFSSSSSTSVNGVAGTSGIRVEGDEFDLCYSPSAEKLYFCPVKAKGRITASMTVPAGEYVAHVCVSAAAVVTLTPIPLSSFTGKSRVSV